MNKITFPLKQHMRAPAVANLQDALQLCLDRGAILANDEGARRELSTALKLERVDQIYGETTRKLVRIFQSERNLQPSGEVDESTADALNGLLDTLSGSGEESPAYVVRGRVRSFDGLPAAGVTVSAFARYLRDEELLGQTQTDPRGLYQIPYSAHQFRKAKKGNAHLIVRAVAADGTLRSEERRV